MLKYIKGPLDTIRGVEVFPVIAFLLFFATFLAVVWWVMGMRRDQADRMAELPLADDEKQANPEHAH